MLTPFLSSKRTPSWTDRVLYSTYTDSPDKPDESNITNLLYTSIPSYTTSDHVRIPSPRKRLLLTDFLLETNCMSPSASLPSTIIEGFSTSPSTSCQLQSSPRSLCYPQAVLWPFPRPHRRIYLVAVYTVWRWFRSCGHFQFYSRPRCLELVEVWLFLNGQTSLSI